MTDAKDQEQQTGQDTAGHMNVVEEAKDKLLQAGQVAKVRLYQMLIQKMSNGTITSSELRQYRMLEAELGEKTEANTSEAGEEDAGDIFGSIEEVAKFYGKSVRTIYRWQQQGMPAMPDGRFSRADIDAWRRIKKGLDPAPAATGDEGGQESDQQPGAGDGKDWWDKENKRWQAKDRELNYRKRIGELIEKKRVEDEFVARVHAVKQALISLERSLPPNLVACRSEREMSAEIHKAVHSILENFSRPLPPHLQPAPDGENEG